MDPERKIEKLLQAYAKKRRAEAGDPLKLHPATRRLLQGEAASTLRSSTAAEDGRRAPKPGEGNLLTLLVALFRRRLVFALCVVAITLLGASIFLPALGSAKRKAQSAGALNHLREIGVATRQFAEDNKNRLPASLDEVTNALGAGKVLIDTATGKPFVYVGAGERLDGLQSNAVLAYSPADKYGHAVLFADGRVETVTGARFAALTNQKPLALALADESAPARLVETPPAAAPAVPANSAPPPPSPERMKINPVNDGTKAGELAANTRRSPEPASGRSELAGSVAKTAEPVALPAPIGTETGTVSGAGQTASAKGVISGTLAATEHSDRAAQNRLFNGLTTQANAVQPVLTAIQNSVQAVVPGLQKFFKNNAASAQATPVLQSFQVQRNGDAISVVDRDGSVYHGSVQSGTAMVRNGPAPADALAARAAPPQSQPMAIQSAGTERQAAGNYFFRVAGTNRTLNQNVVFTGNFLANSGAPQTVRANNSPGGFGGGGGRGGAGSQFRPAAANASQQSALSTPRIVGTAAVASTNQIEINAVPVMQ